MGSSRTQNSTRASKRRLVKPSSPAKSPIPVPADLVRELGGIGRQLRSAYSVGVTVKLAIDSEIGEHEADISYCLGWHVLDPIAMALEQLSKILVGLGGDKVELR